MRELKTVKSFRRDYSQEAKTYGISALEELLMPVIACLLNDQPLPSRYVDHPLSGNWKGYRDCHIKPDLVLIYQKPDNDKLRLIRLGSHAELSI